MKTKGEKIIDIIGGMPDGETRPYNADEFHKAYHKDLYKREPIEEEKLSGKKEGEKLLTAEEFYKEEPVKEKKDIGTWLLGHMIAWCVGAGLLAAVVYVIILLVKAIIAQL